MTAEDRRCGVMNFFTGGGSAEAWLAGHPRVRGVVLTAERPIFSLGGAVAPVPVEATAFPHGDASDDIIIVASWFPVREGLRIGERRSGGYTPGMAWARLTACSVSRG